MRNRLIELLTDEVECNKGGHGDCSMCEYRYADKECEKHISGLVADHLLANDVIVQSEGEWVDNHCTACGMTPIGDEAWTEIGLTPPKFECFMSFCPCCGAKMNGDCEHREWFGDMALYYCNKDREICEDVSKCTKGGEG